MTFPLCDTRRPEQALPQERPSTTPHRRALKVSLVREELVELTDDPLIAIVLNQLLYWTQRVKDFDLLLEEEKHFNPECNVSPRHGWIYKTADELTEETMLRVSRPTMRKYLKILVEKGWVDERDNPHYKWDKTVQYRVNLRKLRKDLLALGYALPGYSLHSIQEKREDTLENKNSQVAFSNKNFKPLKENFQLSNNDFCSEVKNLSPNEKTHPSKEKNLTSYTYTETTSENTNKEHRAGARAGEQAIDTCDQEETPKTPPEASAKVAALMVDLWRRHVNQEEVFLTDERKRRLESLLVLHFQNDLRLWEQFCLRVKTSPFLMGEGKRKWHITLDWTLAKGNLLRILDGSFDDSEQLEHQKREESNRFQDKETHQTLASIEDPVWKNWCAQLTGIHPVTGGPLMNGDVRIKAVLSLSDLKQITKARFKEFDGKLVWIECFDTKTLNKIEDLRLRLLNVVQATYPHARSVRAKLSSDQETQNSQTGENNAE